MANIDISSAINAEVSLHTLESMLTRLPSLMTKMADACKNAGYDLPDDPGISDLVSLAQTSSFMEVLLTETIRMCFRSGSGGS